MGIPKCLISLSVFTNELFGGKEGYSLCATMYEKDKKILVYITNKMFWFDPDHCRKAYLLRKK
jgi:hypothetical protein